MNKNLHFTPGTDGDRYELHARRRGTVREYELKLAVYLEQWGMGIN
jgi:hypothetical protein